MGKDAMAGQQDEDALETREWLDALAALEGHRGKERAAHRLLQTRTRTLDGTLRDLFTNWYRLCPPMMSSQPHSLPQPEPPHGFWCSL